MPAVAARTRAPLNSGLRFRSLFEIQMRVVVRPGHPLAGARRLQELVHASWLSMAAPGNPGDLIQQSFIAAGLPAPVPTVHCGSHSVVLDLIAASDLVALLPPALSRSCIAAGRLAELPLAEPLVPLHVGVYTRADSPMAPAANTAAQIIVVIARRIAASGDLRRTEPTAGVVAA